MTIQVLHLEGTACLQLSSSHSPFQPVVFSPKGAPISVMFLVPGVTPWKTTLPGVVNGANNPGIRVFEYDRVTLNLQVRSVGLLGPGVGPYLSLALS